jgi:hypothetical protein
MFFRRLYYSFPVRLLVLHFRNHLVMMCLWLVLALFSTGLAGRFFGMHYLMLTPEYRGSVDFWSFLISGAAFGAFVMIWNLTSYLLCASRFPFLATLDAPFTKFSINNSLIPLGFLAAWLSATIWFQWHDELTATGAIFWNVSGFLIGTASLMLLIAGYLHFTNKDIGAFLRPAKFIPRPGGRILAPGQRIPTLWEIKVGATRWRVDTYLNERMRPRLVRSVAHYNQEMLEAVFRQNHWNAVVVQLIAVVLLMGLGIFMESEWVRIPTAASLFLLTSMAMAMFGAIGFWFRQWSTFVFIALLVLVNFFTGLGIFNYRNRAYGLDYRQENRVAYTYAALEKLCSRQNMARDRAETIKILEKWLAKNQTPNRPKPKMVFLCVSGGGMRSALWTMQTLQQTDRLLHGRLLQQTMLITGASGGMLGAAYLRELYLRQQLKEPVSPYDTLAIQDMGKDLLNPVSFAILSNDVFFPMTSFQSGGFSYRKDRGYLFEYQFNENCRGQMGRRLAEYRAPEAESLIPMMLLSPYIINDSRRLLISPQGVSYLMRPPGAYNVANQAEVDGVDFGRLFDAQDADSLAFTNALRMNCTYPLILPNVWLPTTPSLEIMDAGVRDNYGLGLATRFAQVFRSWIEENTSGIVFVQIRCWEKVDPIISSDTKGIFEALLTPATAAGNITSIQDFEQDNALGLLSDLFGKQRVDVVRFTYRPVRKQREASLSLHLSRREKVDLLESYFSASNMASVKALQQILGR